MKYGVTRDYVLGLEVVLADGRVLDIGGRTVKDVAGLRPAWACSSAAREPWASSTRATVRLRPLPPAARDSGRVLPRPRGRRPGRQRHRAQRRPCRAWRSWTVTRYAPSSATGRWAWTPGVECLLVVQSDSAAGLADVQAAERICVEHGADFTAMTEDRAEGETFMAAPTGRDPLALRVGTTARRGHRASRCRGSPTCSPRYVASPTRRRHRIATVGHAGDGNFHPLITYDPDDADATAPSGGGVRGR